MKILSTYFDTNILHARLESLSKWHVSRYCDCPEVAAFCQSEVNNKKEKVNKETVVQKYSEKWLLRKLTAIKILENCRESICGGYNFFTKLPTTVLWKWIQLSMFLGRFHEFFKNLRTTFSAAFREPHFHFHISKEVPATSAPPPLTFI